MPDSIFYEEHLTLQKALKEKRLPFISLDSNQAMEQPSFELKLKVRDYECDLQGIVNNANYAHYTEHTRHEFLLSQGISFADLHAKGIDVVVARMQMAFKAPLKSQDEFLSTLTLKKEGLKYIFTHHLYRLPDKRLMHISTVECVSLKNGRISNCSELDCIFTNSKSDAKYS